MGLLHEYMGEPLDPGIDCLVVVVRLASIIIIDDTYIYFIFCKHVYNVLFINPVSSMYHPSYVDT